MTFESRRAQDSANHAGTKPEIPDYELLRRIGQGGYGDVWLGRGLTGAYRAVKIVWRERFADDEPFHREFRGVKESMAGSLDAGQLALLHVGQNESAGFFYYVMELADDVETGPLVEPSRYQPLTAKELKSRRGRLPAAECIRLGVELARSLAALHARGLVHRDIKPSNIIFVNGAPKLADVGLVAASTDARTFVGTQGYLPPEGPGTPAADVFALGKVIYELATGCDRDEFPRLPAELGEAADRKALFELNEILLQACEPVSERRYRDAGVLLQDLLVLQNGRSLRRRRMRGGLMGVVIAMAAVAIVGGSAWWKWGRPPAAAPAGAPPAMAVENSLAVLPFENLSGDQQNGYLADGMQEDVLTNLAGLRGLKVVSRTSVLHYRGTTKTASQIGAELGVAFVLIGSLRREADHIRLSAQLVDTRTDRQVWARNFDREIGSMLALQSDLAGEIVPALHLIVSPGEKLALAKAPTTSESAYDLFLRARSLRQDDDYADDASGRSAETMLEEAVAKDPGFVRAWVELSMLHTDIFSSDRQPDRIARAEAAIAAARRLASHAPEVLLGLGRIRQYLYRDSPGAMFYYQKIQADYPNYPEVHTLLGYLYRHLGRWSEAVIQFKEGWRAEPGNLSKFADFNRCLLMTRRYAECEANLREQLRLHADNPEFLQRAIATVSLARTGSRQEFDQFVASLSAGQRETKELRNWIMNLSMQMGDEAKILELLPRTDLKNDSLDAMAVMLSSRPRSEALAMLDEIKPELELNQEVNPLDISTWTALAKYYALRGDRSAAHAAIDQVRQLMPESSDAMSGQGMAIEVAKALAWLGEKDEALAEIARIFKKPSFLHVGVVRHDVAWLSLHGDSRFEAILADPRNSAPLLDDNYRPIVQ